MESLRFLVVDDNIAASKTMMLLFQANGYISEMCGDSKVAVQHALNFLPDVILLDIGMPNLNGWEVCVLMRKQVLLRTKKIYALTGYGEAGDIQRSMESGMNYHFTKPLDWDEFWLVLKRQTEKTISQ